MSVCVRIEDRCEIGIEGIGLFLCSGELCIIKGFIVSVLEALDDLALKYLEKGLELENTDSARLEMYSFFLSLIQHLRTVPIIVIVHTVCASRDTRISYGWCLLMQGYFCAVQNYTEKAELSKCS